MDTNPDVKYSVRAVHCDYHSTDEEVYQALKRATDPLDQAWERLGKADRIAIKFNQDWAQDKVITYQGHRQQLVDDSVARATIRLLRERTHAELYAVDIGVEGIYHHVNDGSSASMKPLFDEMRIPYIEGEKVATDWADVPGGGVLFQRYPLPRPVVAADEVVSVQKLKNHVFMGVTATLKNLFALMSIPPNGRPRTYYHHLVRMPYMLSDLGKILDPALNILDAMVTQAGMEWGKGDNPRIGNTLIAGNHPVATDACAMTLMGHDPKSDWPTPPFHRDRNALLVAAENGYGSVDLNRIDFQSEVKAPIGEFFAVASDPSEMVVSWLRTTSEQALYYRDHRREIEKQYAGNYILLQMNQVKWSGDIREPLPSRRQLSGDHPEQGMWMKFVDPQESEEEHFEPYQWTLQRLAAMDRNDAFKTV